MILVEAPFHSRGRLSQETEMHSASPQTRIQASRIAMLADDTEITFLPGGGHMATARFEREDGAIELCIELFDRHGVSGGRETATIRGSRLAALF